MTEQRSKRSRSSSEDRFVNDTLDVGEPHVATIGVLAMGRAAEFTTPVHQRLIEKAPREQVGLLAGNALLSGKLTTEPCPSAQEIVRLSNRQEDVRWVESLRGPPRWPSRWAS